MQFLKFLIWTAACVAFGVFLATSDLAGRTPLEHLQRTWKRHAPAEPFQNLGQGWKKVFALAPPDDDGAAPKKAKPAEHYLSEEREALNRLVAKTGATP